MKWTSVRIPKELHSTLIKLSQGNEAIYQTISRLISERATHKTVVRKSKEPSNTALIGRLFKEEYQKAFGHEYVGWGAKQNGQIAQWLKSLTVEQATWLVKHYMAWNNPFAVRSGHSLDVLITRYVELVSDYKRPKDKFKRLDAHNEQKEEIRKDAVSERFGERIADTQASRRFGKSIQDKAKNRISEGSVDPFIPERVFAIPSEPTDEGSFE